MKHHPVKNIIFDFGGVIMNIDPMAYVGQMMSMGCNDLRGMHDSFLKDGIYRKFESGLLSPAEFRERIRMNLPNHAADHEIDHAWNLILRDIPGHRVEFLKSLKSRYRAFLLSNTNPIHYDFYHDYTRREFGIELDSLFEKSYYSHLINRYKPDHEIFEYVLQDSGLKAEETLFIDDLAENVESARQCGLQGFHLTAGKDVAEINLV